MKTRFRLRSASSPRRQPKRRGLAMGRLGVLLVLGLWLTLDIQVDMLHKTVSLHLTIRQEWKFSPGR